MTRPGDPAFPSFERVDVYRDETYRTEVLPVGGMTLRDYFAAHAPVSDALVQAASEIVNDRLADRAGDEWCRLIAAHCYRFADAMLAAREGK
jgi:exopolyphosphatase/pppGpp-phosphohydrolase